MEKWVGERQFEELEMEAFQEFVAKRFEQFKQAVLPGIVEALSEVRTLKSTAPHASA